MDAEIRRAKKRKGGIGQRQQQSRETEVIEGTLYPLLMSYLAQGILSGVTIHAIAKSAADDINAAMDDYDLHNLKALAAMKGSGHVADNVAQHMKKASDLPHPLTMDFPYSDGQDHKTAILLPHEYFAAMYEEPERWRHSVMPDKSLLGKFWEGFQHHPCMSNHPAKSSPDWKQWCVPLMFYGDEVPVVGVGKIWSRSALIFEWLSIMANAGGSCAKDTVQYTWGVFEKFATDETLSAFWAIMLWSFTILFTGNGLTATGQKPRTFHSYNACVCYDTFVCYKILLFVTVVLTFF